MEKKVLIIGLGLIGGSYAKALKKKGYYITGYDINNIVIEYALKEKIIDKTDLLEELIKTNDFIVLSIYPAQIIEFIRKNKNNFKENTIITDTVGVKECYYNEVLSLLDGLNIYYIPCHPMAGKETLGIWNSNGNLFKEANFLIIRNEKIESKYYDKILKLASDLNVKKITYTSSYEHDLMIGFTSQLTHIIAVCLMNAKNQDKVLKFTGDSYRDLTRIADIDVNLWSELFFCNKEILNQEIEDFIVELKKINMALNNNKFDELKEILSNAKNERKKLM